MKTYPSGYIPDDEASLIGCKSYRNAFGLLIHLSSNIRVQGGIFADNTVSVDVDHVDNVTVSAATVIGESESYRQYLATKNLASKVCGNSHFGIELHTQLKTPKQPTIVINDVTFSGFSHLNCANAFPFTMDDSVCIYDFFE
jgi:hypothetical protein